MVGWIFVDLMIKDTLMSRKIGFLNDFQAEDFGL